MFQTIRDIATLLRNLTREVENLELGRLKATFKEISFALMTHQAEVQRITAEVFSHQQQLNSRMNEIIEVIDKLKKAQTLRQELADQRLGETGLIIKVLEVLGRNQDRELEALARYANGLRVELIKAEKKALIEKIEKEIAQILLH